VIEFDGYISDTTLESTRYLLTHPQQARQNAEHNYALARRYYSYGMLRRRLQYLLADCFGEMV
jgi:spore maturation protein CgeB